MGPLFYYTARNMEGLFVRGALQAASRGIALANLRTRALFVTSLTAETSPASLLHGLAIGPVRHTALVAFFRSFATLVAAGVPMRRALDVTIEQCADVRLHEALCAVRADVEAGVALSVAMEKRPKQFSTHFVAMIRAGELGGVLDGVLARLATFLERDRVMRKRLASALTYPAILGISSGALIVFLLASIVPMFATLYEQMHVALPAPTAFLLRMGAGMHNGAAWISVGSAASIAGLAISQYIRTPGGATSWEALKLQVPLFGPIWRKAILARFTRMLGSLLKSGVGLVSALEVVADVVGSRIYAEHMHLIRQALKEGDTLAESLSQNALYDPLVIQMVRVGEETGSLDAMLLRVAEYYEIDVESAVATLGATLEPVLILALGGLVGFIVFSIFIPLYTLIGNIK